MSSNNNNNNFSEPPPSKSPRVRVNWASPNKKRSPGRPQDKPGRCGFHATLNGFMLSTLGRKLVSAYLKKKKNAGFVPKTVAANSCPAVGSDLFWSYIARWLAPGNANFHKGVNSNLLHKNTGVNNNVGGRASYGQGPFIKKFSNHMFGKPNPTIVLEYAWHLHDRTPIQRIIRNESGTYKLSHAYVEGGFFHRFRNASGRTNVISVSHAICAYIKNGEERIFDSNAPHSVAFNWVDNPNHVRDWYRHFYWNMPYGKANMRNKYKSKDRSTKEIMGGLDLHWDKTRVAYTLVYVKVVGNSNNLNFT